MGLVAGNQAGGSITDPSLAQGTPFAFVMMTGSITLASQCPQVTINGTTISYTASNLPFLIVYGTY
ncbi:MULTISPECIES: hypothetical protein [Luteibacter]|uniref:hypothetical protein n=1 Tax=Luteibacter TaxID=242605 RepID=UPI00056D1A34|nr:MULTISPECIES: hypothetical protein [unclassified Luteibacter]